MSENNELHPALIALREDVSEIKGFMSKMADAIERLARLEERHGNTASALERAFTTIAKIDARLAALEKTQPVQNMTSNWITNGAWAAVSVLVLAALKKAGVI